MKEYTYIMIKLDGVKHGSDSQENALIEIKRFFGLELTHGEDIEL